MKLIKICMKLLGRPTPPRAAALPGLTGWHCAAVMLTPEPAPEYCRELVGFSAIAEDALLRHILLHATTHADVLSFTSRCARVSRDWRRVVRDDPAYFAAGLEESEHCECTGSSSTALARQRQGFLKTLSAALRDGEQDASFMLWGTAYGGLCSCCHPMGTAELRAHRHEERGRKGLPSVKLPPLKLVCPEILRFEEAWQTIGRALEATERAPAELALTACSLTPAVLVPIELGMRRAAATGGLKTLSVGNNAALGDEGLATLARWLPLTIVDLSFYNTGCGDQGMEAMSARIATLRLLERLCCSDNDAIDRDGWTALGAALLQVPRLAELTASRCRGMGSAGALALMVPPGRDGGACAPSLRKLDLRSCGIGEDAAEQIQTAWRVRLQGLMLMQAMAGLAL
jgi:hypothetical protein